MHCPKCGSPINKTPAKDPWCMYQVRNGVVVNDMFHPDHIPSGWYDSPKAAKAAIKSQEAVNDSPLKESVKKVDGRTKEGRELKAKLDGNSTGSD